MKWCLLCDSGPMTTDELARHLLGGECSEPDEAAA